MRDFGQLGGRLPTSCKGTAGVRPMLQLSLLSVLLLAVRELSFVGAVAVAAIALWFAYRQLIVPWQQSIAERDALKCDLVKSRKLESIGQLAAGIAHEINTPIQCVGANVQFLRNCHEQLFRVVDTYDQQMNGSPKSWLQRKAAMDQLVRECRYEHIRTQAPAAIMEAADAVKRVIEIVRAMKAMSHPGMKEKVATNVNELIRNAATVSRSRWKYVAEMKLELDDSLPDVPALPAELGQVLVNLVVNAADAIAEKNGKQRGRRGTISVRTSSDIEGVRIEVEDSGCGVPDELKHRVFEPFFTTKDVGKGTGQGLAITHDVITIKHGGIVTLDSKPGQGTKFTISLPFRQRETAADDELLTTAV